MTIHSSHTFGQDFRVFLENGGKPSEFALEIGNPNRHTSVLYAVAHIISHDTSLKPTRVSFETRDMSIPHGGEIIYSAELRGLLQNIQKTTEIITGSNLIEVSTHFEHPESWGLG